MRAMCHIEPRLQETYVLKLLLQRFLNSQNILFFPFGAFQIADTVLNDDDIGDSCHEGFLLK